ncbi:hypothetical protein EJP69_16505 [Variovorax gossypii]|uniref:RelA/SpoT domain-containing protein n=1 Tax=Variovorax gossypii TaxID=1679495 RepID=A0A431TJR2_9BURK|nr:hypothetical protein [Variovorax gossypii]RTQ33958.1 hypothetical protein EJP69_16505 [Variovorax gossypii]
MESTKTPSTDELAAWYRAAEPRFRALADNVAATINSLLKEQGVAYLTVSARVKTLESLLEKFSRKRYDSFEDLTDFLGVRVIVYLDSEIPVVCRLLEKAFHAHPELGVDKSEELAVDQIGYRSVHYICDLGLKRLELPELAQYKGLKFEIQIRTVLQHAWAEIEHDRSYKFSGDLPQAIRRRLNLLAGTLELVDREFSTLAKDLDEHAKQKTTEEPLAINDAEELNPEIVGRFLESMPFGKSIDPDKRGSSLVSAFDELVNFGVSSVGDLRKLLSPEFLLNINQTAPGTKVGIVRRAMMFNDIDKYLAMSYKRSFGGLSKATQEILRKKYGDEKINDVLKVIRESRKINSEP